MLFSVMQSQKKPESLHHATKRAWLHKKKV